MTMGFTTNFFLVGCLIQGQALSALVSSCSLLFDRALGHLTYNRQTVVFGMAHFH